jgi:transcriptional regulator with XRE-family HTH domain
MSKIALARHSGVRAEALGRLERGERLPELRKLAAIARVFRVPAGWFVFGEGAAPHVPLADARDRDQRLAETWVAPVRRLPARRKRKA